MPGLVTPARVGCYLRTTDWWPAATIAEAAFMVNLVAMVWTAGSEFLGVGWIEPVASSSDYSRGPLDNGNEPWLGTHALPMLGNCRGAKPLLLLL
jgi:hypothetical protein